MVTDAQRCGTARSNGVFDEDSCGLRDLLRLSAADADDPAGERASVAQADLLTWDASVDPPIPANTYHDSFGNFCHVIRAPAGRLTLSTDFLVQDSGKPDEIVPQRSSIRSKSCRWTR